MTGLLHSNKFMGIVKDGIKMFGDDGCLRLLVGYRPSLRELDTPNWACPCGYAFGIYVDNQIELRRGADRLNFDYRRSAIKADAWVKTEISFL